MSSFEFEYCFLTAQSPGCDPNKIQGNVPEFQPSFYAQMAGRINPRRVYHAAMAIYCDDMISAKELIEGMANWAWMEIKRNEKSTAFKVDEIERTAELSVLMYLYPWAEEKRSVKKCASWVRVAPQTWERKYRIQRAKMVHELAQMKSEADWQFRKISQEYDLEIA